MIRPQESKKSGHFAKRINSRVKQPALLIGLVGVEQDDAVGRLLFVIVSFDIRSRIQAHLRLIALGLRSRLHTPALRPA